MTQLFTGGPLVVKGPPGTGKSQTITNIIAAAVAKERKVLFVSEKMAALDVVHRRLRQAGLGPLTLELHSNKINKRTVLDELRRTKDAATKGARGDATVIQKLGDTTTELNSFVERLHKPLQPCELTPYQIMGHLVRTHELGGPSGYTLEGAAEWSSSEVADRRALVTELAERLVELGPPPQHPWRGVRRSALDPSEQDDLVRKIGALGHALDRAKAASQIAVDVLAAPSPVTIGNFDTALGFLRAALSLPQCMDRTALAHPAWRSDSEALTWLVEVGELWSNQKQELTGILNSIGWAADFAAVRLAVVTKGKSFFRFLDSNYRAQIALFRSYLSCALPKTQSDRVALIDKIMMAQLARKAFESAPPLGDAFGQFWKGDGTDWTSVKKVLAWRAAHAQMPEGFWAILATADVEQLEVALSDLDAVREETNALLSGNQEFLDLDVTRAFGVSTLQSILIANLQVICERWMSEIETLSRFIAFATRGRTMAAMGGKALMDAVHDGALDPRTLPLAFERAYAEILRGLLFQNWPELRAFDGESQERLVQSFQHLDRARIALAKEQIAAAHSQNRPRSSGGVGPLGVLNAELAKRRGHLPVRQLLDRAGPAIQQLKPVFMMSPLSVAQFLKPGGMTFDLLVMDEASQIEPVDALGAIARVQQIVVVGDERQLPPTAFFKKLLGDQDQDEEAEAITIQAKDAESILDLCLAKGVPHRMLSWHYRSKHQSLIAVSNKEFYENKLFIVPSPYDAIAGMGLKFHLLKDAPYERGGTRTNPTEAKIVAEAVMRHALETPEQSLGVATFSVAQRQVILKELELLRRVHPEAEDFFSHNVSEPFFIKNLENIQGDERDVIFISVGYGKTEQGYLAHAFGPLSGEGGERRLNVLISRAKLRCDVFCNFTGADIDLERTRARGVAALKMFLTFAETGKFGLGEVTGGDHDSEFEAQVCERLRALGYDVKAQIGASGFRVDLAVADPEKPGRFVLGIECDGAQYHSSRSARDRDRLRQQVLEAHGWIIHRIWSADWYLRPQEELKKVEAAIAAAKAEWRERDEAAVSRPHAVPLSFEGETHDDMDVVTAVLGDAAPAPVRPENVPYREASFAVDMSIEPHEASLADMAAYVVKIVQIEGPIHIDEIATRIRTLWGLHRAGSRIRGAVAYAAKVAAERGLIAGEPFYQCPSQDCVVRDRSEVSSATLRKPDMLPPVEIEHAVLRTVDDNFGAGRDELVLSCSRLFGFASTSAQLRSVFEVAIERLIRQRKLEVNGELLVRVTAPEDTF